MCVIVRLCVPVPVLVYANVCAIKHAYVSECVTVHVYVNVIVFGFVFVCAAGYVYV